MQLARSRTLRIADRDSALLAILHRRCSTMKAVNISQPFGCDNASFYAPNLTNRSHEFEDWHAFGGELDYIPIVLPSTASQPLIKRPAYSDRQFVSQSVPGFSREASIPVDQLRNEVLWPGQRSNSSKASRSTLPVRQTIPLSSETYLPSV